MLTKKNNKKPSVFKIIVKLVLALFLLYIFLGLMIGMIYLINEDEYYDNNLAKQVDWCNRYYYEKDYAGLRDHLQLYDDYDEAFDMYWEMADGYSDYMEYKQWLVTPEDRVPGSSDMASYYRQRVIDNAANCEFEQNKGQLQKYAESIK